MISKETANYRIAEGSKRCGNCSMFRSKDGGTGFILACATCTLVRGTIRAHDTCDEWEKKKWNPHFTATAPRS
jgi:hypothetical protein